MWYAILLAFVISVATGAAAEDLARRSLAQQSTNGLDRLSVIGNPSIPACPTSNCPAPPHPPVLSTQVLHGKTTKGAEQHEWLSSAGLFVSTGAKQPKDPISGQKVTQYIGVMQAPGAGTAWALNTDSVRNGLPGGPNSFGGFEGSGYPGKPGAIGSENGTIGYELDFTNWDAHSAPGSGPFTVGQYVHAQGSFTSLSAVYFDAHMGNGAKAWHSAIFFNGEDVVDENTIVDATHSKVSYNVMGVHQIGINMSQSNADLKAIVMKEGQSVCFSGLSNCVSMVNNKLSYRNKAGSVIFSIDEDGNAFFAGRVNQGALR